MAAGCPPHSLFPLDAQVLQEIREANFDVRLTVISDGPDAVSAVSLRLAKWYSATPADSQRLLRPRKADEQQSPLLILMLRVRDVLRPPLSRQISSIAAQYEYMVGIESFRAALRHHPNGVFILWHCSNIINKLVV